MQSKMRGFFVGAGQKTCQLEREVLTWYIIKKDRTAAERKAILRIPFVCGCVRKRTQLT
jgi:hypothetical protein